MIDYDMKFSTLKMMLEIKSIPEKKRMWLTLKHPLSIRTFAYRASNRTPDKLCKYLKVR